ncbi:hypothetical protein GCM10020331_090960 [Ectobacillus funiculus]
MRKSNQYLSDFIGNLYRFYGLGHYPVSWGSKFIECNKRCTELFLVGEFGWFYVISVSLFFLGFAIYLMFSPYGSIRLGKQDEKAGVQLPFMVCDAV